MSKPKPPAGLQSAGMALWGQITGKYDLRADERTILEHACREVDLIESLSTALAEGDLMVKGSMGQPIVNPIVGELRQHRNTLGTLLGKLKLPDDDTSDSAGRVSAQARAAAQARWSRRGA